MPNTTAYTNGDRDNGRSVQQIRLSKSLSRVLRHSALESGLKISPEGFIAVNSILKLRDFRKHTLDDISAIVANCNKQRFTLKLTSNSNETGTDEEWFIRANQGHSIQTVNIDMQPILSVSDAPCVVHGTYLRSWPLICASGLSRMTRNHVHFAGSLTSEKQQVVSGIRSSCDLFIYIDLAKALQDGMKFFRSSNGVILTEGFQGIVPTQYFSFVQDKKGKVYSTSIEETIKRGNYPRNNKIKSIQVKLVKVSPEVDFDRLVRRYKRRLAEIEKIEHKQAQQIPVDAGQLGKVQRKQTIQNELSALLEKHCNVDKLS